MYIYIHIIKFTSLGWKRIEGIAGLLSTNFSMLFYFLLCSTLPHCLVIGNIMWDFFFLYSKWFALILLFYLFFVLLFKACYATLNSASLKNDDVFTHFLSALLFFLYLCLTVCTLLEIQNKYFFKNSVYLHLGLKWMEQ